MRTLTRTLTPDSIGAVESVKAASDIYAPVGGVVEEINEALNDQPNLLNKKPESDGECLLAPCLVSWLGEARHMCRRVWGARTVTGGMGYGRRWSSELHRSHPSPMLGAGSRKDLLVACSRARGVFGRRPDGGRSAKEGQKDRVVKSILAAFHIPPVIPQGVSVSVT